VNEIFAARVAIRVYGLAAVGFGLVGLSWGDFAAVWQPVPASLPGRTTLAYIVAALLLLAGLSIQRRRSAALGTLTLTTLYSLGVILLHVPLVIARPTVFVNWSGTAEQLALVAGGLVAYAFYRAPPASPATASDAVTAQIVFCGRLIFGVCLILFASAHLFYLKATADFVPAWLPPNQMFWAYATAAGHFLAGVAILSGIAARLAARLLAGMFVVFEVLVHAPTLFADPHSHFNWAANAMNFALIASAWIIAASIDPNPALNRQVD
jgi:uncharacterized membrane protein YphA (DoxX/SURF4 family)